MSLDPSATVHLRRRSGRPADAILLALRAASAGMTRTDIRDYFSRNKKTGDIGRALEALARQGLAWMTKTSTEGRAEERWFAVTTLTTETTLRALALEVEPAWNDADAEFDATEIWHFRRVEYPQAGGGIEAWMEGTRLDKPGSKRWRVSGENRR